MEHGDVLEEAGFFFIHNFDSGNLGHVERVPSDLILSSINHRTNSLETPEYEFNVWTRPDCAGTVFENGNRTWFYFGVQGGQSNALVRLNIINLNKQGKMYNQGMAPVTRTLPGQPHWERIRDRPLHSTDDNAFTLTFKYRTPDSLKATTFFAFTYPFSFSELQMALNSINLKFLPIVNQRAPDDIYYCRENLVYSLDGRRTDLLTITSYHGITTEREERLKNLFPDNTERPFKFLNKKVIFISARVHPGETPSSFVFNGFLNLLLTRNDPIAVQLRKLYVFKLVPFLNPDGVARGHYRTDTRGVNLNRVYLNPSLEHHPTVYAARALIRYHHFGCEREEDPEECQNIFQSFSRSIPSVSEEPLPQVEPKKKKLALLKPKENSKREDIRCSSPSAKTLVGVKSRSSTRSHSSQTTTRREGPKSCSGDTLADQVCDLKLQEMRSDINACSSQSIDNTSSTSTCVPEARASLLDDVVVRDCLGSEVHISRSDELSSISGPNPLRQLRDTLKNSISLLIGSNTYPITPSDSRSQNEESASYWCLDCNRDVVTNTGSSSTEDLDPSLVNSPDMSKSVSEENNQTVFCTNCYKTMDSTNMEPELRMCESSDTVSGGDRVDAASQHNSSEEPAGDSNGDTAVSELCQSNENKVKAPTKPRKKLHLKSLITDRNQIKELDSGLFLYIDLHGHASKKGIFMYGNHFEEADSSVECMLLPRIMSLNNLHFHFSSCNFTERNMYLRDRRDGMSREGSGRVAVLKATGLIRSYTLECNYNTGRLVNVLPPSLRETATGYGASTSAYSSVATTPLAPPKYTPHIFEEVGRSLGASILDLTGQHPNSRIPGSEHRSLGAVRDWLRSHTRTMRPAQLTVSRLRPKPTSPSRAPLYARSLTKSKLADVERKENTYIGAKSEGDAKKPPVPRAARSIELIADRFAAKKAEKPFGPRPRCFSENEPKPKTLSAKRRNVLAIRKPNAGKARNVGGVGKPKASHARRALDEAGTARSSVSSKSSKGASGSFGARSFRREATTKPVPSSSSSEEAAVLGWEEGATGAAATSAGKRRPYPPPPSLPAPRLKKIRLKTSS